MSSKRGRMGNRRPGNGDRPAHPSHLKGKAIGLYYARRSKEANKQLKRKPVSSLQILPFLLYYLI